MEFTRKGSAGKEILMFRDNSRIESGWMPRFFIIWTGQAFSLLGSSLVQFALVWWMTEKTGSATVLSTATMMALLPQIVLGTFIGPLIDRLDRKRIMIIADLSIALATGVLMALFMMGIVEVWHVFAIMAFRSLGGAFHSPAMTSSTSLLVPSKHLTRVNGINQSLHGAINILSPPLGALLIMLMPTQGILAIDLVTAIMGIVPLLFFSIPKPVRTTEEGHHDSVLRTYFADLKAGLAYVAKWKGLLYLIFLAMLINFLLAPAGSLMPILVTKDFGLGAMQLALLETLVGIGVISGGLLLSAWGGFKRKIMTSLAGIIGVGVSITLIGLIPASGFWMVLTASFVLGVSQVLTNGPLHAIMQAGVMQDMQGRVFSLLQAGATAMMPLSLLAAGPTADVFGTRIWFIGAGALCVLAALAATAIPEIMKIETYNKKGTDLVTEKDSSE